MSSDGSIAGATTWGSRVLDAYNRGMISAAELWDILLAHMDEGDAERNVDRLLRSLQSIIPVQAEVLPADDWLVVTEDADHELANLAAD
jgi:hypothetical protein